MSDGSSIEWCDATWTIAVGCSRVDHRCDHCYAIPFVHRNLHASHEGLTKLRGKDAARPGVDWNGTVRTLSERLADPLRWRKPRRVFVGSMTDLFHHKIPLEYIAAVFGVMAACPQHCFLVLTKRPARARMFFTWLQMRRIQDGCVACSTQLVLWSEARKLVPSIPSSTPPIPWPLPNVEIGVSVSDQATADAAIPELLELPARRRWVSYEPALGPVDFRLDALEGGTTGHGQMLMSRGDMLHTIVVGGESGPGARPFCIEWARDVLRQVQGTRCRVFVKQLGASPWLPLPRPDAVRAELTLRDRKGGDMAEWPADLRVREWAP